jgi:hypothetical protein
MSPISFFFLGLTFFFPFFFVLFFLYSFPFTFTSSFSFLFSFPLPYFSPFLAFFLSLYFPFPFPFPFLFLHMCVEVCVFHSLYLNFSANKATKGFHNSKYCRYQMVKWYEWKAHDLHINDIINDIYHDCHT